MFSLLIDGAPIEEAFVYRTSLYCWTFDNRLRIYSIGDVEAAARLVDGNRAPVVNYALFHSKGLGASPAQVSRWRDSWSNEAGDDPPIVVDAEAIRYIEVEVSFEANSLLDILIFYDRVYLATDNGLFSIEPFDPSSSPGVLQPESRVAEPCYAAAAGLGTVAASCGPKGLRLLFDDVAWTSHHRRAKKAASESLRAEVGYGTIVNHPSRSGFEFLAGTVDDTPDGRVLTEVKRAKLGRSAEVDEGISDFDADIELTIWDRGRLVIFRQGKVLSVSVVSTGDERRLNRTRALGVYGSITERVISASRVGRFFVVETDEAVAIVGDGEGRRTATGPIVSLRSYPKSHRYQRLATATSAAGLWLLGVDD